MALRPLFNQLSEAQKVKVRVELKKLFLPLMTKVKENKGLLTAFLQMEVTQTMTQRLFEHRLHLTSYASEKFIKGVKLTLHELDFLQNKKIPEVGVFEQVAFDEQDLYRISKSLESASESLTVLKIAPEVEEILKIDGIDDFLSSKLKGLKIEKFLKDERPDLKTQDKSPQKRGFDIRV